MPPKVIKDLARELKSLEESPLEDIKISVNNDNFSNIHADIEGPCMFFISFYHNLFNDASTCIQACKWTLKICLCIYKAGTPYEGGAFRIKLILSQGFPEAPPKGMMHICILLVLPK